MGKLKVVAKKATKKAAKKTEPAPVKLTKKAIKKFLSDGRKEKAMEYEELVEENERLKEQVKELTDDRNELTLKIEELEATAENLKEVAGSSPAPVKWVRGKLPGEKFIKTDLETGKFVQIDKAEWDSLS